jgi:hypothetical protein
MVEFLWPSVVTTDAYFFATDYAPDWKAPIDSILGEPIGRLYGRFSARLTHLTRERLKPEGAGWIPLGIANAINRVFIDFLKVLPGERRTWFGYSAADFATD